MNHLPDELRDQFQRLRLASPQGARPECERAILQALHESRAFRAGRRRRASAWQYWLAVAACVAFSFGAVFIPRKAPPAPRPTDSLLAGFVPLPYGQGDVPLEHVVIVRVNFPSRDGNLQADLLIGQDGMARAVRWIQ